MAVVTPPHVIQASSHPADVFRRQTRLLALGNQGVKTPTDLAVTQNGTPNMSVNIAAGEAIVNGTQNTTSQGAYTVLNDATVNLAVAASDPTNPRIDIVVAQVRDATYSGANNDWILAVVTGTPAGSPAPPATPANAIVLAQIAVAAAATSVTSGNITDKRPRFGTLFKARAFLGAAQNYAGASTSLVNLDTVSYDPNANFNTTSHQYTVPITGIYLVAVQCGFQLQSNPQQTSIDIFVNGSIRSRIGQQVIRGASAGDAFGVGGSDLMALTVGDLVDMRVEVVVGANAGAISTGAGNTYLGVHEQSLN